MGEEIKSIRKNRNITQKELGDFLGCSEAQISYIESGKRKINSEDLHKIANFFNVSYDYLLPKQGNFVNFRYENNNGNNENNDDLISDFKKFAIKKIYGDKKQS